ncbi:glutathione S-transferase [Chromatiales bacterium (ex Bugula neritina AB1)]|nr:glutathione S-transferase [Chromatiales bacterium (ex Bugula neritina AB1)]
MKLFFNPASPYARKVMVVAHECGLAEQIERIAIGLTPVNPNDDLNTDNPLGKIPALVLDNGSSLYDSRVIAEYLDTRGEGGLYPQAGDSRWQALRRQACADGICDAAILARYEGLVRPEEKRWSGWTDAQKNKFRRALAALEAECPEFADTTDIGTLSVAIALDYIDFRYADEAWREACPSLAAWHSEFGNRDSLRNTMPADLKA